MSRNLQTQIYKSQSRTPPGPPAKARGKIGTAEGRQRARIFCLCKDLGFDDEARRIMAGTCRKDGKETMQGMGPVEMARLEFLLEQEQRKRWSKRKLAEDVVRSERLKKHQRVDGKAGQYAAPRALHFLKGQAQSYWGEDWCIELHRFIKRQTGYDLFWDSLKFPRDLHWRVTEGVKAMILRKARKR